MKKILLLFSAVLLVSSVNAQSDLAAVLERNTGGTAISSSATDQSFLATLPGGENLVASRIAVGATGYINIKKVASDGSVSTIKNIPAAEPVLGITCSPSGNFTLFFGDAGIFKIIKFNPAGTILWQKSITIGETITTYYAHTINETSSGEYYLTISHYAFCGLIKLDSSGNLLWSQKMTGPRDTGKCPGFCSAVTSTGGCITSLKDDSYETLINMDGNGNVLWSRSFGDASYRWTKSIKADNLGNFYVMGTYGWASTAGSFVQKIDANGNVVFAKNISGGINFDDAYVDAANEFYVVCQSPAFRMCKIGATGNIAWCEGLTGTTAITPTYYVHPLYFTSTPYLAKVNLMSAVNDSTEMVLRFISPLSICNSSSFSALTTSDDYQIYDAAIDSTCKVNPMPVTIANTGYGSTTTEYYSSTAFCESASVNEASWTTTLTVFPNPATDQLTIRVENIQPSPDAVVTMFDMTGRKVAELKMVNSDVMTITTSGLAPGLYSIILSDNTSILGKQRVVIQK